MNYKQLIFLTAIFLLATPIHGMQPMETDSTDNTEPRGRKRKHDEIYTIYEPSSLKELAARSFVSPIYVEGFKNSSPKNRTVRARQFWTDIEETPIDIQEMLFGTLNEEWKPVSSYVPCKTIKFDTFTIFFGTAQTPALANIIASFFASETAKKAFSTAMSVSLFEIVTCKKINESLRQCIVSKLHNYQSFELGACIIYQKSHILKHYLDLGLKVQYYPEDHTDTLLSDAIKRFSMKKVQLLLHYKAPIPMFSITNNAISLVYKYRQARKNTEPHIAASNMINTIVTTMGKKVIVKEIAGRQNWGLVKQFIIANHDESNIALDTCTKLLYTDKNTTWETPYHLSPNAAQDLLGKAIIPVSQEPVAST